MNGKSTEFLAVSTLLAQGKIDDATQLIRQLRDKLSGAEFFECEANLLFHKGLLQQSMNAYRALMNRHPDSQPARYYYLVGVQMEQRGDYEGAFRYYRSAIEAEPSFADSYLEIAGLLAKIRDYVGAARTLEQAIEFDSNDLRIYANLKTLYSTLVNSDPETYLDRKRRLDADYPNLEAKLGPLPQNHKW